MKFNWRSDHCAEMNGQKQMLYEFSCFRLDPVERVLIRDGVPITLTPKAFDTLLFLVKNSGRLLEKDELMKALWPESFVEENNLSQNIFILRKALEDDKNGNTFIKTVPRRGYRFVAPVKELDISTPVAQSSRSAEYWSHHSPFRGLQVFEPDDAWLFFGRDAEIEDLLLRLGRAPVLAVTGNSGCGKSSLIRAGLVPAIRAGRFRDKETPIQSWRVSIIRPSGAPFDYLAEILPSQLAPELSLSQQTEFIADCRRKLPQGGDVLRNAVSALANAMPQDSTKAHILLVVDQFEEIFTLTTSPEIRERYIDVLLAAGGSDGCVSVHVALVLRADFFPHCLAHPGLSRCLEENFYSMPRMTQDQLLETIEKRLALAGAHAEAGLIDAVLEDVGAEPGDLALLEHALSQLWEKCGGFACTLTNHAYSAIGRLRGALGRHADEVYGSLGNEKRKRLAQKIFLELVQPGENAQDARRRIRKSDLCSLSDAEYLEPLLTRLISSRLVSTSFEGGETFIEVSHESLIRGWPTLREWLAQNREEIKLERRLYQAAEDWEVLGRDGSALLQGARLVQAEEWMARHAEAHSSLERFVQASANARAESYARELAQQRELRSQAEARAEAQRQLQEQQASAAFQAQRAASRLRWFSGALTIFLLAALFATWYAHREKLLAESRALAAQSEEVLTRDQGLALDLAIRGWNTAKTQQSYIAVTKALPQTLNVLKHDGEIVVAVFSPDGEHVLTASYDHTARVWNRADGSLSATLVHGDKVEFAAFSLDGKRIVSASRDHTARVWSTADGRLLTTLQGHTDGVVRAEFSPDGERVVTASLDHTARVWSSADGHLLVTLQGHDDGIRAATFSPNSQQIATASLDHTGKVWSAVDGHLLTVLRGHTDHILHIEFSPDGQFIVTASLDHTARIWKASDGRLLAVLQHDGGVRRATFSPDGRFIVTASHDHTARIWNALDGRLLAILHHDASVNHAEFSPNGRLIVTGGYDHLARVWSAPDGHLLATLQGHSAPVMHASFSPDGKNIVTGSYDRTARIWNITGSRTVATLEGHTDQVLAANFSPDGQRIITASDDGTGCLWKTSDGRLLATLRGHANHVFTATFSPDGQRIVTASADATARIWNAADGGLLATLQGHREAVYDALFSPDGQRIVTASADGTARIWNAADGSLLTTLQGHREAVYDASFSPDGQRIVTASTDGTARVWNIADGRLLAVLQGHTEAVYDASFSPDGQRIVTASADHTARIWNTADGHLLTTLQGHQDAVWTATFSPGGVSIVTASLDGTARIWNTSDGHLLATLQGHTYLVRQAGFSPDGQRIVTASNDHTARVWSANGRVLAILQGHTGPIGTAKFSPDGQRIVTASDDRTARIWQVLTLEDIDKILKY